MSVKRHTSTKSPGTYPAPASTDSPGAYPAPASSAEPTPVHIRPFRDEDYARFVEIGNLSYPDEVWSEDEARYQDSVWDHERYFNLRVMAEDLKHRVIAVGRINHLPWLFDPQKYSMNVIVDPVARRRGVGSTVYASLMEELRRRGAVNVRAGVAKETMRNSIDFLTHRGFTELERGYESRLDVEAFDFDRFEGAEARAAQQGIVLTTLADERPRDPEVLRKIFELTQTVGRDIPFQGQVTEVPFELWVAHDIDTPKALPDAFFLARDGERYVGLSFMQRRLGQPNVVSQELTGVLREYRGRGIAMALKLQTVRYAHAHGYREIRTGNHEANRPMLRINEALGFTKQPAWVTFEKNLGRS